MDIHRHTARMNNGKKIQKLPEISMWGPIFSMTMNIYTMIFHGYEDNYEMNFKVHEFIRI